MSWLRVAKKVDWAQVLAVAEQVRGGMMTGELAQQSQMVDLWDTELGSAFPVYPEKRYPMDPTTENGGCDRLNTFLADVLHRMGYNAITQAGYFFIETPGDDRGIHEPHAWMELDGQVVDITADQFNDLLAQHGHQPLPRVHIVPRNDVHYQVDGE